jgi:coenzyme F420-reducing hydrogenase beta subunit
MPGFTSAALAHHLKRGGFASAMTSRLMSQTLIDAIARVTTVGVDFVQEPAVALVTSP